MATFIDRIVESIALAFILAFIIPVLFVTLDLIKIHAQPDIYGTAIINELGNAAVWVLTIIGLIGLVIIVFQLTGRKEYPYNEI